MNMRAHTTVVLLALLTLGAADRAAADRKEDRKLESAIWVCQELFDQPDRRLPDRILAETRCLAIFPDVVEAAFAFGGSHGTGVVSCRSESGEWSPPVFLKLSEGSVGLQAGYQTSDLVLFFVTEEGARTLLRPRMSLGGEVSVAAGPMGRSAGVTNDVELSADVYIYSDSRGLFAGAAVEGTRLALAPKANRRFYGRDLWAEEILFYQTVPEVPAKARDFMDILGALPWR